ncbi:MAG: RNA-binding S4 domain-containing protein [Hyphomicrobiaceae bacterium]
MARQVRKSADTSNAGDGQRLDKWLWFARVAKTRTLAAGLVADGRVRVNRVRTTKPAQVVKPGDVVTVSVPGGVRVLEIVASGVRRGPASEAALLYEEIVPLRQPPRVQTTGDGPVEGAHETPFGPGQGGPTSEAGRGRPTKKDRRVLDRLRALGDSLGDE